MKPDFTILHHGAVNGVTGSCHELKLGSKDGVLVDCGLFQGAEESSKGANFNKLDIEFPINHIRALLVTHCHIDHVGRIPYLLAAGFNSPIICSVPTAKLLPLVLKDAMQIGITRNEKILNQFISLIEKLLVPLDYKEWYKIPLQQKSKTLDVQFSPAGHVIGSSYIECQIKSKQKSHTVVFSGDLGVKHTPILISPHPPKEADVLILESTYGDKKHQSRERRREILKEIVEHCFRDRGVILIPAFSIGRTQELLYEFEQIIHEFGDDQAHEKGKWEEIEVVIDSPLANNFTEVYQSLTDYWDREGKAKVRSGRHPLSFEQMTTIGDHREHLQTVEYLKKTARPTIVIAASGMCAGGRIVNYLKSLLHDPRTDVVFVGYQSYGTPGRDIQQYGPKKGYVVFDGERYQINAAIHTLHGYSAHADQEGLLDFVREMEKKPQQIRLVHGDTDAKEALQKALHQNFPEIEVLMPTK